MHTDPQIYTHPALHEQVTAIGGSYVLIAEQLLAHQDKRILVFTGHAVLDSTCCGAAGCAYALVPGIVAQYRCQQDTAGRWQSRVWPIRDAVVRNSIRNMILVRRQVHQVQFL